MAITATERTDIIKVLVGMFNGAPGATYLNQLTGFAGNTGALAAAMAASPAFTAIYPEFMTSAEFAGKFIDSLVGGSVADADKSWAVDWMTAKLEAGESRGAAMLEVIDALDAVDHADASWGAAATLFDNKVAVASYYTVDMLGTGTDMATLQGVIAGVTADTDVSSAAAIEAAINGSASSSSDIRLSVGYDNVSGTSGNDTFSAKVVQNANGEQTNQLATGDSIDGGAGYDVLNATVQMASALNTSAYSAIAPETTGVEEANFTALSVYDSYYNHGDSNYEVVTINAKDMLGLESVSSTQSDASLLIENLTTLTDSGLESDARNTEDVVIRMDHTGNDEAVDGASSMVVLFDNDYLLAGSHAADTAVYWLEDRQNAADDASTPLKHINVDGITFTVNGVQKSIYISADDMAAFLDGTGAGAGTWEGFVALLNSALATAQETDASLANLSISLDYSNLQTHGLDGTTLPVAAPAIVLSATNGDIVAPVGYHQYDDAAGAYDVYGNFSDEPLVSTADPVTATIELDKVGRGAEGGYLIVGAMSTDLNNNWDYSSTALKEGVEVFNVTVEGTQAQMSSLAGLASTNNTLAEVNVHWADGSLADLIIGNHNTKSGTVNGALGNADDMTTYMNNALKDVRMFNAADNNSESQANGTTVTTDVELHAYLSDEVVAKYMDLTDSVDDALLDNADFSYTFGSGNDLLNLNISQSNLAASGTTNREDFTLTINSGAGNDTIQTQIGDGESDGTDAWYVNSNVEQNLTISAGAGDDTVQTWGAGTWSVDLGAGNDVIYSDNSGSDHLVGSTDANGEVGYYNAGRAVWVLNTADQITGAATARDITDLVSDTVENYAFYKSTVTVTLNGLSSAVTIEAYNSTDNDLNNAIKAAIEQDNVLSKLLVAEDGPAGTLVVKSLVDGVETAEALQIAVTGPSSSDIASMSATQIAAFNAENGTTAVTASDVLAIVTADVASFDAQQASADADYLAALANDGANDLQGAASGNATASTIVDGTGEDVIVLSTSGLDTETVNLTADGEADVIYNATNAIITGLELNDTIVLNGFAYSNHLGTAEVNQADATAGHYVFAAAGFTGLTTFVSGTNVADVSAFITAGGNATVHVAAPIGGAGAATLVDNEVTVLNDTQSLSAANFGASASPTVMATAANESYIVVGDVAGDADNAQNVYSVTTDAANVATVTLIGTMNETSLATGNFYAA